ncbi:hypothetical protein [Salmon gill poxvirus]
MKTILGTDKIADLIFFFQTNSDQHEAVSIFVRINETSDSECAIVIPLPGELNNFSSIDTSEGINKMKEFYNNTKTLRRFTGRTTPFVFTDDMYHTFPMKSEFRMSNGNGVGKFDAKTFNVQQWAGSVCGDNAWRNSQFLNIYFPKVERGIYGFKYVAKDSIGTHEIFQAVASATTNTYVMTYDYSTYTQLYSILPTLNQKGFVIDKATYSPDMTETSVYTLKKDNCNVMSMNVVWPVSIYNMLVFFGSIDETISLPI